MVVVVVVVVGSNPARRMFYTTHDDHQPGFVASSLCQLISRMEKVP
jgi:hypothetical protein